MARSSLLVTQCMQMPTSVAWTMDTLFKRFQGDLLCFTNPCLAVDWQRHLDDKLGAVRPAWLSTAPCTCVSNTTPDSH
jgi:hypothetical protein